MKCPIILFFILLFTFSNQTICHADNYNLYISTMEVVDRNDDGKKEGLEIFYILKKGKENIELSPSNVLRLEAYLYEDRTDKALMSFWRIDAPEEIFGSSIIYLSLRQGFAYNIYIDKIVPALLEIKIILSGGSEVEAQIKESLSFLAY